MAGSAPTWDDESEENSGTLSLYHPNPAPNPLSRCCYEKL